MEETVRGEETPESGKPVPSAEAGKAATILGRAGRGVVRLREQYPRWGKEKLLIFLREEGHETSASTVGRILIYARKRGILREPVPNYVSAGKRARKRPYAIRKPKDYAASQAGDIVQMDTLDLRPLRG